MPPKPPAFTVDHETRAGLFVVRPTGEIDILSAPQLQAAIASDEGRHPVVLDLRDVSFVDSTGLTIVFRCVEAARDGGPAFCAVKPVAEVLRTFELTGLVDLVHWVDSVDEAARS
jgi:anti-anti-sigma factor